MGHIHLGTLPKSAPWKAVVALLDDLAADEVVIAQSAIAAERELSKAAYDANFVETLRLLAMVPQAAKAERLGPALRELGLPVGDEPNLADLIAGIEERLDRQAGAVGRSDFGELSGRALIGTFSEAIGDDLPGLFDAEPEDLRRSAARLAGTRGFQFIARAYFGRLLSETLASWLDRTLSTRVGPGRRFADADERSDFDVALTQYCSEATFIIREFAGGWQAKTLQRAGRIDSHDAQRFGAVAFKKILEELQIKRGGHV